jgi:SET domain-containing protein
MTGKKPAKNKNRKRASRIEVRKSGVHGRGVYATKPIRKGARIIEYTGKRVLWREVPNDLNDPHTFLFGLDNGKDVIDPTTGGNEARWINHSCDPNCEAVEEDAGKVFIYALRDLRSGEELFYDYALQVDEPITSEVAEESKCFCGSSRCRGTMLELKK